MFTRPDCCCTKPQRYSTSIQRKNIGVDIYTLQVATILVAMVPKILELAPWFVKVSLNQKKLVAKWRPRKNFNLEGWWMA